METASGPIYEFTCSVDREVVDEFDSWLAGHIEDALNLPGVSGAEIYKQEDDEQGRARRIAHYYFFGDTDLEQFLAMQADVVNTTASDRFEGQIEIARRVLRHAEVVDGQLRRVESCLNCGNRLEGQYCGNCGQRATSRLISVWELLRDAFGDLLDLDSRVWRTLVPLIARPGRLTRDYLEGRRARYMPPFRTYLVLSIVFFVVAFFDPREDLSILFEPVPESSAPVPEDTNLADEPAAGDPRGPDVSGDVADDEAEEPGNLTFNVSSDGEPDTDCDLDEIDTADWPRWLASRLTEERLKAVCDRVIADDGRAFLSRLLDNVPAALFFLLPLMALVLKVLYPLSKRYYVEHLLFVVHYHAFVFLILSLQVLFARLGSMVRVPETVVDVTSLVVAFYVPIYLYKSLRRVYGQGRLLTALKFLMLILAYFTGLLIMFALVALFAAFTI